jgi:hypothetical protein
VEIARETDLAAAAISHQEQVIGHRLADTRHHIKAGRLPFQPGRQPNSSAPSTPAAPLRRIS